jgi:hypothetical protein
LVGIFPADQDSCGVNFNVALQDTDFVNMMWIKLVDDGVQRGVFVYRV